MTQEVLKNVIDQDDKAVTIESIQKYVSDYYQLKVADLAYDLDTLHVSRAGQPLKLNPLGLKLLAVLMQKSPAVVRREALEDALWGDDCPDSDSLRSHIHQLRQVLDKPFASPLLHTLHGVGYRLAEQTDGV